MTFEERLEKLAERHEALTQTVELLAAMQRDNEARLTRLAERVDRLTELVERLTGVVERLTGVVGRIGEHMTKLTDLTAELTSVVRRHEERLENLERGGR